MVGYRNPPSHTQFKKGQSGNPGGRPKTYALGPGGERSANALALKEAERSIKIREGEEIREISAIEAVLRAQLKSATSGNGYAQRDMIARYDKAERERHMKIAEDCETMSQYVERRRKSLAEAAAQGLPAPNPLPHPDDVVIDLEYGVRFIGPVDEEGVARLERTLGFRDVLIMQSALDERKSRNSGSEGPLDEPGSLALALCFNGCVPERYRLSDRDITLRIMQYADMTKRSLLKELYRAWQTTGVKMRRGRIFPPTQRVKQVFEMVADIAQRSLQSE